MNEVVIFYRSFYESIKELPPKSREKMYTAIMEYQFSDAEPKLNGVEKAIWTLIKPQIDANNRRRECGKSGGQTSQECRKINGFRR